MDWTRNNNSEAIEERRRVFVRPSLDFKDDRSCLFLRCCGAGDGQGLKLSTWALAGRYGCSGRGNKEAFFF